MSLATKTRKPVIQTKRALNKYAPYWEDDTTMNPTLVKFVSAKGDWIEIILPDGTHKQVHYHTLGIFRTS
jgi:hypothetical protein